MNRTEIPILDIDHPMESLIEKIIVPDLKVLLFDTRQSLTFEEAPELAMKSLESAKANLQKTRTAWADRLPPIVISDLEKILIEFSDWITEASRYDYAGLRDRSLLAKYFGLEKIVSQLVDSVDQGRIDRGAAPTRFDLINTIVEFAKIESYLEIGCCNNSCFDRINCRQKVGVDPESGGTLRMTSDAFFAVNVQAFDLIFIDGLHESPQVDLDIINAINFSSPHGIIVMHDCDPRFEVRALVPRVSEVWNGDVWKSFVKARMRHDLDCATGLFDHGTAVLIKRPNSSPLKEISDIDLTWENFQKNREEWLQPKTFNQLLEWIKSPTNP